MGNEQVVVFFLIMALLAGIFGNQGAFYICLTLAGLLYLIKDKGNHNNYKL